MYARADQVLVEKLEAKFPLHAVELYWEGFEPHLSCFDIARRKLCEFDLWDMRFAASRRRVCVGRWSGDEYLPCPKQALVGRLEQCEECAGESLIPFQECLFEPRCDGELCGTDFCRREHAVYLAFYDTRPKLGMSSSRRIDRRLIEQGADAYSVLGRFPTRKKAREAEKEMSSRLRIPQAHRQEELLAALSRPVDVHGIRRRYEAIAEALRSLYGLEPEPLEWLDSYPIQLPLPRVPRLVEAWGLHEGEVLGTKGRWIIFESSGLRALNLSDLLGRFLSRTLLCEARTLPEETQK